MILCYAQTIVKATWLRNGDFCFILFLQVISLGGIK
jgi:hypothetical protein